MNLKEILFGKVGGSDGKHPVQRSEADKRYYFGEDQKSVRNLLLPDGVNSRPLSYMVVNDGGVDIYFAGLYADKLPKKSTIATTYTPLFNYRRVTSCVFVDPLGSDSVKRINKRISMLDAERYTAIQKDNINRYRTISTQMQDAESWAKSLDSGMNTLFEVAFVFGVWANSLMELQKRVADFQSVARKSQVELSNTFAATDVAYKSCAPLNKMCRVNYSLGKISADVGELPFKRHIFDMFSLSTIYSHVDSEFFHDHGVVIGRNLYNALPVAFDPYDRSHFSYGLIIAGMPGYGKSACWKMLSTRLIDFGVHICAIDFKPRGLRGEYSAAAEAVGGVSYTIAPNSKVRINLFDISEQTEFDEESGREYRTLRLYDKIESIKSILMVIATAGSKNNGSSQPYPAEVMDRMQTIIRTCIRNVYGAAGIRDKDPDTLYESSRSRRGSFGAGRRKKQMPVMRDFYYELLCLHAENDDTFKEDAFRLLLDAYAEYVGELYYCPRCLRRYTEEEFLALPVRADGKRWCVHEDGKTEAIREIHGTKAFFDAQSTISIDSNLPITNFDVSQVPESERPIMMLICQAFVSEYFVKTNGQDVRHAKKLLVAVDEAHLMLPYADARDFLNRQQRLNRSRNCGLVLIVQSIQDFARYDDAEDILKNAETYFLFKHNARDAKALKDTLQITDSQVQNILSLGGDERAEEKRPGEMCLYDVPTKRCVFLQTDYLKRTEQYVVETDVVEVEKMMRQRFGSRQEAPHD